MPGTSVRPGGSTMAARVPRNRGRRIRLVGVVGAIAALAGTLVQVEGVAATAAVPGSVALVGQFPNFWVQRHQGDSASTAAAVTAASGFVDPTNDLLFMIDAGDNTYQGQACSLAEYSTDAVGSASVPLATLCSQFGNEFAQPSNSKAIDVAVDPVDRLLFFIGAGGTSVVVIAEDGLKRVASWHMSSGQPNPSSQVKAYVRSLSWDRASDRLLVITDNTTLNEGPGYGFSISSFDVQTAIRTAAGSTTWSTGPEWTQDLSSTCEYSLRPYYATADPYRYENQIVLPCVLIGSAGLDNVNGGIRAGVVQLTLKTSGCTAPATECPDGSVAVAVAPGQPSDFLPDAASGRAFLPAKSSSGLNVLAYDATEKAFIGRVSTGTDMNSTGFGLDRVGGRVYAVSPSGMFLFDGRRTPLQTGWEFDQYAATVNYTALPILPASPSIPYRRVLVPHLVSNSAYGGQAYLVYFDVYADGIDTTLDPPANAIDQNTYKGAIPPGSQVTNNYGGGARAYGLHTDWVGGGAGSPDNAAQGQAQAPAAPFSGTTDLIAGTVWSLDLRNGSGDSEATALKDPTQQVSDSYSKVTANLQATPPGQSSVGPGPQPWPYASAQCPDAQGNEAADSGGATSTLVNSGQQSFAPFAAGAHVDCGSESRPATSSASFDIASVNPTLTVASASANGSVTPPGVATGIVSRATGEAQGVRIDLGPAGSITIGDVAQMATATAAGTANSASASRAVTIRDVALTANGTTTVLCGKAATCDPDMVADKINGAFPTLVHVSQPVPADPYGWTNGAVGTAPAGSPGGYTAAVESSATEQDADQKYNAMIPEESVFLPALRIVLYGFSDGASNYSREVLDLAGVDVDAQMGINVLPPFDGGSVDTFSEPGIAGVPASSAFAPGTPSTEGSLPTLQPAVVKVPDKGLLGLIERTFAGLNWLVRSPVRAFQMLGTLVMLGLPFLVMDRRRQWIMHVMGGRGR